jgi:hypothetical protein
MEIPMFKYYNKILYTGFVMEEAEALRTIGPEGVRECKRTGTWESEHILMELND